MNPETKTQNQQIKEQILRKIQEYQRIVISRHIRPDGDAVGSTKGLKEILTLTYPEKEIYLINEDYSDYMSFLGSEDKAVSDDFYRDALMIVIDTATEERISNKKYKLAKELIKIDHHVDIKPYGDISWVEDERSAACEMIADFYLTFRDQLKISKDAATYIYTGLVTDSGRFRYASSSGETLRCAAALLDQGIDTDTLFAHLYLEDYAYLKFQSAVFDQMRITENGVAYLYVSREMKEQFRLTEEQASNSVSFLNSIKGSLIWIAFIEYPDGSIRVRLRSRFVTINKLAENYRGGGHECASGATVYDETEMQALLADADALLREYKQTHEGWL